MRIRIFFHGSGSGSGSAEKKIWIRIRIRLRIRPEIEMKKKIFLYFRQVGIKFDIITHQFMLEFVDSDLYFVQDKNDFINPLLQVGSGSGSVEKSTGSGSGSGGPKITGSDRIRIRILIPAFFLSCIPISSVLYLFSALKFHSRFCNFLPYFFWSFHDFFQP